MYPEPLDFTGQRDLITAGLVADSVAFEALLGEWDGLLSASLAPTPFLTSAWVDCWRRYARGNSGLNLLAVRASNGQLLALAPLIRRRRGLGDRLEFMGTGPAGADYLDLIVKPGTEAEAIQAIAGALHALQLPLHLDHLPPSSYAARLASELARTGWTSLHSTPDVCPYIDLSGHTGESYLLSLGPAHRANVRRRLRALRADFDLQFAPVITHQDRRAALEALVRFSENRWRDRGGTSAFPDLEIVAFHQHMTRRAMDQGWLRLYALTLNGAIAGVMYGFAVGGRFFFYQHGFDAAYSRYSIGIAVMALSIDAAIAEGLREFDMLYGHESYKALWAREQRPLERIELFPPRVAGTLLRKQAETRRALRLITHRLGLRA
jgi:CelD/BcsL family acetyltransferase involved in cellulose biosynthesis